MRWLLGLCIACSSCGGTEDPASATPDSGAPGPYANIARVAVPASFVANGDGYQLSTGEALFDVGKAFYSEHPDDFDMLIVWTDFLVADRFAFSVPLRHDIEGIGLKETMQKYGWSKLSPASAGSNERLQHIVLMNGRQLYATSAYSPEDILAHEVGHRWSANVILPKASDPDVLVDQYWSHWSVYANIGGPSAVGYGTLLDQGGGSFAFEIHTPLRYSQLELYQQGLLAASEVGQMFYVEGATAFAPAASVSGPWSADSYGEAVAYQAKRVDFTIDDVIAAYGPRSPAFPAAQNSFKMAFVLVCKDSSACSEESLAFVDAVRVAWSAAFADATGGRATVTTTLAGS